MGLEIHLFAVHQTIFGWLNSSTTSSPIKHWVRGTVASTQEHQHERDDDHNPPVPPFVAMGRVFGVAFEFWQHHDATCESP